MQKKQKTFNAQQFADSINKTLKVVQQQREHRESAEFQKIVTFCKLLTRKQFDRWVDALTQEERDNLFPTFDHWLDCAPSK